MVLLKGSVNFKNFNALFGLLKQEMSVIIGQDQYSSVPELMLGLTEYFAFYNEERLHQALDYKTPSHVYASAEGGGAEIKDRFKTMETKSEEKAIA